MIRINDLAGLNLPALRQLWQEYYGSEPPVRMSQELLIQAIAYQIQEKAFPGLSCAARTKLGGSSDGAAAGSRQKRVKTQQTIKTGTRFLRQWQGRTYEVIQAADGNFLYAGASYRSLSQIARHITGTRWSGPAFFGLTQNAGTAHAQG